MKHKYLSLLSLLIPNLAFADGGITLSFCLAVASVWQIITLLGVIIVECLYLSKKLDYLSKKKIVCDTAIANIISTLLCYHFSGIVCFVFILYVIERLCYEVFQKASTHLKNQTAARFVSLAVPLFLSIFLIFVIIFLMGSCYDNYVLNNPNNITTSTIIITLLLCFIESYFVEYLIFNHMHKEVYTEKEISRAILKANLLSYLIFFGILFPIVLFLFFNK